MGSAASPSANVFNWSSFQSSKSIENLIENLSIAILNNFRNQFLKAAVKREEKQACLNSPEREQARPQVNNFERSDPKTLSV